MAKSILLAVLVLGQAATLGVAGAATLWWSNDLMLWLIWLVGEEWALGSGNVIRLESGATLLTNPIGMMRWMVPFWVLGVVQISSALTLVWLWSGRLSRTILPGSATPAASASGPDE